MIRSGAGDEACRFLPATELATALFGDAIAANLFLLGYALQRGCLPVGLGALERAIELNGRAVQTNLRALACGTTRRARLRRGGAGRAARRCGPPRSCPRPRSRRSSPAASSS